MAWAGGTALSHPRNINTSWGQCCGWLRAGEGRVTPALCPEMGAVVTNGEERERSRIEDDEGKGHEGQEKTRRRQTKKREEVRRRMTRIAKRRGEDKKRRSR